MDSEQNTNMKESQPVRSCISCGTTTTPLWRAGPTGPKSMCNRCGIKWTRAMAKKLKKKSKSSVGSTHFSKMAVIVPSDDSTSHSTENSYDDRKSSNGASTRYQKTKTVKPKASPIINSSKRKEAPRTSPRKKTVTTSRRATIPKSSPNPLEPYLFLNAAVNEYQSMNERMMFQQSLSELQQEIDFLKQENQHQQELLNHWRSEASEISMPITQELSEGEASTAMDNMLDLSND